MRRQASESKIKTNMGSYKKLRTEMQEENEEEDPSALNIKLKDNVLRVETSESRVTQKKQDFINGKLFTFSSNIVCDRIRKEKLASILYERKVKYQNMVTSTLQRRKVK